MGAHNVRLQQTSGATMPRHDFEAVNSVEIDSYCWWLMSAAKGRKPSKSEVYEHVSVDGATNTAARICQHHSTKRRPSWKRRA
ncbi:unnamed protein product, partial [Ectocarpus sp. 4 AP-2014]